MKLIKIVRGNDDDNKSMVWRDPPDPPRTTMKPLFYLSGFGLKTQTYYSKGLYNCLFIPNIYNPPIVIKNVLISIIIPTFNEENLHRTLSELSKQTAFQKYDTEVIIADFDPSGSMTTYNSLSKFRDFFPELTKTHTWVPVDRKGIGYARHQGIVASSGTVIVNFDADAKFANVDGLEKLVEPILRNECVMTCCDNLMDGEQIDPKYNNNETMLLVKAAYATTDMIQKDNPVVTLEPGMSFTRHAYDYVGGFNDIKQSEGFFLSLRIIYNFGLNCKKHVPNVTILVSPRRAVASTKFGILDTWFNYDNAFRTGLQERFRVD